MPETKPARAFTISGGPLVSSLPAEEIADDMDLPAQIGEALLLALPRNPRELFVCWSVDWPKTFAGQPPADRQAHIRVSGAATSRSVAIEPMRGTATIGELEPGETYQVELGYFAPSQAWHVVVAGHEVMMPLADPMGDAPVEYATLPLHLTFQRVLDALDCPENELMPALAELQSRAAEGGALRGDEHEVLESLGFSEDQLSASNLRRAAAASAPSVRNARRFDGNASPTNWPS